MILDKQTTYSEGQLITATADSTNVLDHSVANQNNGAEIELLCQVEDTMLSAGATTLTVSLVTSVDEAFSAPVTLVTTPAIPKATLVRGYQFALSYLPAGLLRYSKLVYTVATGPFTAGRINAGLVHARQTNTTF